MEVTVDVVREIEELMLLSRSASIPLDALIAARAAFEGGPPRQALAALERFRCMLAAAIC